MKYYFKSYYIFSGSSANFIFVLQQGKKIPEYFEESFKQSKHVNVRQTTLLHIIP
jgi:hypothetical protein